MDISNLKSESLSPRNKKIPDSISEAFSLALSFYPELSDKFIFIHETIFKGVQHTSRAYPPILNLNKKKSEWIYTIVINKSQNINTFFHNLSFNQRVGLLAHELSHIVAYNLFSRRKMVVFSIKYALNKKFVRRVEKETDLRVIARGAGKHLFMERIDLFKFQINNPYPYTEDIYIGPNELLENLKKYPNIYSDKDIEECINKLKSVEGEISSLDFSSYISFSRKFKHSAKIIFAFFPEFMELFYMVVIKKRHLK